MLQEEKIRSLDVVQVGQRIREVRKSQGYKSVDIAAQLDISADQYCRIENGKSACSLKNLYYIAQYFHVSLDYLLSGTMATDNLRKLDEILANKTEKEIEKAKRVLEAVFT